MMCHLCGRDDVVMHGRSHILPSWLYRQLDREDPGGLVTVSLVEQRRASDQGTVYNPPSTHPDLETPHDVAWYCNNCEAIFGGHDDFSAKFLKDPSNMGGQRPKKRHLPSTPHRPEIVAIEHPKAWMWLRFVLSVVFRMHQSHHSQYIDVAICDEQAEKIRQFLLSDEFDAVLFDYDITTVMVIREGADHLHGFSTPAFSDHNIEAGFKVVFGVWGVWFMVGYPKGTIPGNHRLPQHTRTTVYCPIISVDHSLRWFAGMMNPRS